MRTFVELFYALNHETLEYEFKKEFVQIEMEGEWDREKLNEYIEKHTPAPRGAYSILEYVGYIRVLDKEFLRPLFDEAFPQWMEYITFNKQRAIIRIKDDVPISQKEMTDFVLFCNLHGLLFEIDARHDETTRCGFLAYDSLITPYIEITIFLKGGENESYC